MLSFFVFFSARFSFRVLAGFFFSSIFLSWTLLIVTAPVVVRLFRVEPRRGSKIRAYLTGNRRAAKMASSRRGAGESAHPIGLPALLGGRQLLVIGSGVGFEQLLQFLCGILHALDHLA